LRNAELNSTQNEKHVIIIIIKLNELTLRWYIGLKIRNHDFRFGMQCLSGVIQHVCLLVCRPIPQQPAIKFIITPQEEMNICWTGELRFISWAMHRYIIAATHVRAKGRIMEQANESLSLQVNMLPQKHRD
jgi:hypothetical protein